MGQNLGDEHDKHTTRWLSDEGIAKLDSVVMRCLPRLRYTEFGRLPKKMLHFSRSALQRLANV